MLTIEALCVCVRSKCCEGICEGVLCMTSVWSWSDNWFLFKTHEHPDVWCNVYNRWMKTDNVPLSMCIARATGAIFLSGINGAQMIDKLVVHYWEIISPTSETGKDVDSKKRDKAEFSLQKSVKAGLWVLRVSQTYCNDRKIGQFINLIY